MYDRLAVEAEGSYLPLTVRDRGGRVDISGARIGVQGLYYPMKPDKGLYLLAGGGAIEAVYMPRPDRPTICISSQVGCALACDFCLTGKMGFGPPR